MEEEHSERKAPEPPSSYGRLHEETYDKTMQDELQLLEEYPHTLSEIAPDHTALLR